MAYTIQDNPVNYSPVGGPNVFTVYSDDFEEDNFRYVCEVFLSGSTDAIAKLKSVPHPQYGWGKFDISRICGSLVETTFEPDKDFFSNQAALSEFTFQFGQQYTSGSFIEELNEVASSGSFFNGYPMFREVADYRNTNTRLISSTNTTQRPLTARKRIQTAEETKQWLYFMNNDWQLTQRVQYRDDELNVTDIYTGDVNLQQPGVGNMIAIPAGKQFIESNTLLTDLSKWSVRTLNGSNQATSEWTYYELLPCTKWNLYSIHFVNRWGGVDSMSFGGRSVEVVNTSRQQYKQSAEKINSTGILDYSGLQHTVKDYMVRESVAFQLQTDWINVDNQVAAIDLQTSPQVWLEDKDGGVIPVSIDQDSIEIRQSNNQVINVAMVVRYDQPTIRR